MLEKNIFILITIICMCLLTACRNASTKEVYKYSHEEILSVAIKKTIVYSDKLTLYFTDDSLTDISQVICYDDNLDMIEENASYAIKQDKLTIHSINALDISGLSIKTNVGSEIHIRYLDSDNYAMMVHTWADDIGMVSEGDYDTYYSEDEKAQHAKIETEHTEKQTENFQLLEGVWENDDKTLRLEVKEDDGKRIIEVFDESDVLIIPIAKIDVSEEVIFLPTTEDDIRMEENALKIVIYDNESWGAAYYFYLYNNNTELIYDEVYLKRIK